MKRRSFLQGLLAAIAAPVLIAKKVVAGAPVPRSVKSLKVYGTPKVLMRKYRMLIYDEEKIGDHNASVVMLFARNSKGELPPVAGTTTPIDIDFEVEER
jgi:hypothetical protein